MSDARRARMEALKAQRLAIDEEIRRLAMELAADMAGLQGRERALFVGGDSMGLHVITKPAKVSSDNMTDSHRIALSESRHRKGGDPFLPAIRAATPKGFTLRSLAAALDVSQPTLSAHRKPKGHVNSRPIPRDRAERIETLTGWPADARHWPCGIT